MKRFNKAAMLLATAGLISSGVAQAELFDRGGGLIYDDALNITWLADANYARTSGYPTTGDGRMNWIAANAWAADLSFYDSVRNVNYTDWRLPTVLDTGISGCTSAYSGTDCGYNVQTVASGTVYSELAHMYHNNLGFKSYYSSTGTYQPDFGIFGNGTTTSGERNDLGPNGAIDNLKLSAYWFGTANALDLYNSAWLFSTGDGSQGTGNQNTYLYAWAVRDGDVAAVPEPESYGLLLAGLGLLGVVVKWRRLS